MGLPRNTPVAAGNSGDPRSAMRSRDTASGDPVVAEYADGRSIDGRRLAVSLEEPFDRCSALRASCQEPRRLSRLCFVRRPFLEAQHLERRKKDPQLARPEQECVPGWPPSAFALCRRKGLVEEDPAGCEERFDPRGEGAVEKAKDEHRAEACRAQVGGRFALEVDDAGLDPIRRRGGLTESREVFRIAVDGEDFEAEFGAQCRPARARRGRGRV